MNHQLQNSIQAGLEFLASNQAASGSYKGLSAAQPTLHNATTTDTVFFTALIAGCLEGIDQAAPITRKAVRYLLAHKSQDLTWNYWERGSKARPYPDDLDDTACALAAVVGYDRSLFSAGAQAKLAQALIACETQPGGPYITWLVPKDAQQWRDVDPAVNANIGYLLTKLNVRAPGLEQYIGDCIVSGQLTSPYYVGSVPTLYFLARWYRGQQLKALKTLIQQELKGSQSPLQRAMLITAACKLGDRSPVVARQVQKLLSLQRHGGWPAAALYYEPPQQGAWQYAGSPELTTAFAVEALTAWQSPQSTHQASAKLPTTLRDRYHKMIQAQDRPEVIDIAGIVRRAGGWSVQASIIRNLNRGSRNGWLAYTIYDDFLDEEGNIQSLGVANMAMRQSISSFKQAINDPGFARFIDKTFEVVDAVNTWEVTQARNPKQPPNYGFYAKLAGRSWGHVIAPTGVLLAAGFALDGPEVKQLHDFFRHYLIAKQLCDDAHDWLDDLRHNRITPVVARLLRTCPDQDDSLRQRYFWQHTIDEVNQLICRHVQRAQIILNACDFLVKKTELQQWLDGLESVCTQAEQGRQDALTFIKTFTSKSLVN